MSSRLSIWSRIWIAFALLVWGFDAWLGWAAWTSEPMPQAGFRALLAFVVAFIAIVPFAVAGLFFIGKSLVRAAKRIR